MILIAAGLVVVLAIGWGLAIWRLVIPPARQLARIVTDLTPILIDLRTTFTGVDNPFAMLQDIIVRNERSLDRLETASDDAATLAAEVKTELGRTQHAATLAVIQTRNATDPPDEVAADAAAAGTAAIGAPKRRQRGPAA